MGRKSSVSDAKVFAAVAVEVAEQGRLTMEGLRNATGLSTGSVYHRYRSREGLLAETWLDALRAFHEMYIPSLNAPGDFPGECAALSTPRFSRAHHDKAVVLACGSARQFLTDGTPREWVDKIEQANARARVATERFIKDHALDPLAVRLAVLSFPLAAVKNYLPTKPVPELIDAHVRKAAHALLAS